MRLLKRKLAECDVMNWKDFHDYMRTRAINQFQQQTRKESIKNSGELSR